MAWKDYSMENQRKQSTIDQDTIAFDVPAIIFQDTQEYKIPSHWETIVDEWESSDNFQQTLVVPNSRRSETL